MRRVTVACLMLVGLIVLAPSVAHAQATITGVVKDASGGVLPGVTVEASSPDLIEKVRTTTTDAARPRGWAASVVAADRKAHP